MKRRYPGNEVGGRCFEPHSESEVKCKAFDTKISFHSDANKTTGNVHMKSFALSLAFIMRFDATQKCPIAKQTRNYFSYSIETRLYCGNTVV